MDITGISNSQLRDYLTDSQRTQTSVDSFQAILDKAIEGQNQTDEAELREACESFESYFLQMMFREMRKTSINADGFMAKSYAEQTYTDMLDEEVSKSAAKSGGIGLADMMYRQMMQNTVSTADL